MSKNAKPLKRGRTGGPRGGRDPTSNTWTPENRLKPVTLAAVPHLPKSEKYVGRETKR